MSSFHNRNLLYRPSLSIWTARKKDKGESTAVTERAGANAGSANVYKALLPENPRLEAVQKWANAFRDFIYTNTLPWDDAGWRIGTVVKHMDFMAKAGDKIREGEDMVDMFIADYAKAIENARFTLANLFDEDDYPGVEEVRSKFRFTIDVQTMPNADDFRVVEGVPPEEVDKLVSIAKNSVETRVQGAMDIAYNKLFTVVSKMATTLEQFGGGEIKKFNDTLVGNITELVDAMPALNITGDPRLDTLATQARELTQYALLDLRKDENVRKAAIIEAKALAKAIAPDNTSVQPTVVTTVPSPAGSLAATFADMLES
jgi:hypothetical protein